MSRRTANVGTECVACGNCSNACPFGAISVYKGLYAKVDKSTCKGCGKCELACPAAVIDYQEQGC